MPLSGAIIKSYHYSEPLLEAILKTLLRCHYKELLLRATLSERLSAAPIMVPLLKDTIKSHYLETLVRVDSDKEKLCNLCGHQIDGIILSKNSKTRFWPPKQKSIFEIPRIPASTAPWKVSSFLEFENWWFLDLAVIFQYWAFYHFQGVWVLCWNSGGKFQLYAKTKNYSPLSSVLPASFWAF